MLPLNRAKLAAFLQYTHGFHISYSTYGVVIRLNVDTWLFMFCVLCGTNGVNCLWVLDRIPKATLSKDPELNPMYVGEIVTFTCNVDVSWGWEYEWWKDGTPILETNKTISIHLSSSNKGIYSCLATRGENTLSTVSERIAQDVLGRYRNSVISVSVPKSLIVSRK